MRKALKAACAVGCLSLASAAQTGPGIPRIAYPEADLGKRLYLWGNLDGRVPKIQMFQGYLLLFQNRGGAISSWDIADPEAPKLISSTTLAMSGDEHVIYTFGAKILAAGAVLDLEDPRNPKRRGRFGGLIGSVWPAFQWPYLYTTRTYNGDTEGRNVLTILDYSDVDNPKRVKDIDASSLLGYPTGGTHVVGNLLMVTSGDVFKGVSVWDLGDPLNPELLSASKAGPGMYTSQIYGRHIVTTGPKNEGTVGVWDYSDPDNVTLVKEQRIANMGDYAHFQNGYMFGMNIFGNRFVKVSMQDYGAAFTGSVGGGTGIAQVTRYVFPLGNLLAIGDPNEPTSANRTGGTYAALYVHAARPDSVAPSVLFANPAPDAVRVAVTGRIGLVFDEDVDNRTLTAENIAVRAQGGPVLEGVYTHSTGIVNFTPARPLAANTTYAVTVRKGGVKDWTGNAMAEDYVLRFSTGSALSAPYAAGPGARPGIRIALSGPRGPVHFSLPGPGRLSLHDLRGRTVQAWNLGADAVRAGLAWDGRLRDGAPAPPGLYTARLAAPTRIFTAKVILPQAP